jgi:hypothetical protein
MMIALFFDNHIYLEWHETSFNENSHGIFLEMGLLEFSKREYALIMVMFTKNFFVAIGLNVKCVELLTCQQMDIMWKICHAIVRGDFLCH